jgi:hypothetical protein
MHDTDAFVTLVRLSSSLEAEMVKNLLEEEGIPVLVAGGATTTLFSGLGTALSHVELQVPEDRLAEAERVLAAATPKPTYSGDYDPDLTPDDDPDSWTYCPGCGSEVSAALDACASCGKAAEGSGMKEPASRAAGSDEGAEEIEESDGALKEQLADRAFRSALFGLVALPPLLHIYSLWQLLRLSDYEATLSSSGRRKTAAALLIDFLALAGSVLLLLSLAR